MYEIKRKLMWSSLKTGIVITLGIILFFLGIFFSGNLTELFSPKQQVKIHFRNINGLRPGAPVWLYGIEVGNVNNIRLIDSGTVVTASVLKKYFPIIKQDAVVHIMTMGLLGDKYLEISPGSETASSLRPGGYIRGKESVGFEQIMSSFSTSLSHIEHLARNMETLVNDFHSSDGTISRLIKDPALYNEMTEATKQLMFLVSRIRNSNGSFMEFVDNPDLYKNLTSASKKFDQVITKIDSGNGLAASLVDDTEMAEDFNEVFSSLRETSQRFSKTASSMDSLLTDVKKNPRKYFNFSLF
ncbi:MAG: MlaD family protein [Fibrobacterota bacterium]